MQDPFTGVDLGPEEEAAIRHRRKALALDSADAPPLLGLALSGGGVRSATFALGLLQGMAHGRRLDRVDILSTVSGGGYAGAFLRSLFLPRGARFRAMDGARILPTAEQYRARHDWAMAVLRSPADVRQLSGPLADADALAFTEPDATGQAKTKTANPLWWLREHGRYLAPNGSGDYLFAMSYILRAWVAMQYVALVPLIGIFLTFKMLAAAIHEYGRVAWPPAGSLLARLMHMFGVELSPLMLMPVGLLLLIAVPVSTSYWLTATLVQWRFTRRRAATVWAMLALASLGALYLMFLGLGGPRMTDAVLRAGAYFVYVQATALCVLLAARKRAGEVGSEIYPSELRRVVTDWLAVSIKATLFCLALAVVDSLALKLVHLLRTDQPGAVARVGGAGGLSALIVTTTVWLVQKLQAWLPRFATAGRQASQLARFLPGLVLLCGFVAYGIMALMCAAIGYLLVWHGVPFRSEPTFLPAAAALTVVVLLTLVTGLSPRFLNLSSLHYFYAGRLTRAYLGATNARRLAAFERAGPGARAGNVREYDEADALCLKDYHRAEVLAPVHLINVTANETQQADSQLVQRDRKGNNLCVGPGGISLAGTWRTRAQLAGQEAEPLAVGKWIAISGAAASSGMGQATTLGSALLLTFANVRLGYWWYAPELAGRMTLAEVERNIDLHHQHDGPAGHGPRRPYDLVETQRYLLAEASASYSRVDQLRLNLSDGGHFENTAAYELIRRRVPVIVVSDAAADPKYEFDDFGNLARKARIDLGAEISILDDSTLQSLSAQARQCCGTQQTFQQPQGIDSRCLIPYRIEYADGTPPSLLLLIKPRVPADAPPDLQGYCRSSARFPQEPTSDQFFGEAQWESYRRLGEILGRQLFPTVLDEMVETLRGWRAPTPA